MLAVEVGGDLVDAVGLWRQGTRSDLRARACGSPELTRAKLPADPDEPATGPIIRGRAATGDGPQVAEDVYSVALNSQIAIASITSPSATITPASSSAGTCQPHQVTPGSSARRAAGEMLRWLNTSRRIGSTA